MILTDAEKQFIKSNKKFFINFYERRVDELIDKVVEMDKGEERDLQMLWLKEYKAFLNSIKIIGGDSQHEKPPKI